MDEHYNTYSYNNINAKNETYYIIQISHDYYYYATLQTLISLLLPLLFYKLRLFRLLIYILLFMDNDNNIVVIYKI